MLRSMNLFPEKKQQKEKHTYMKSANHDHICDDGKLLVKAP